MQQWNSGVVRLGGQCHPALREERKPEYSEKYDSVPSRMRSSCAAWFGLTSSMPCSGRGGEEGWVPGITMDIAATWRGCKPTARLGCAF